MFVAKTKMIDAPSSDPAERDKSLNDVLFLLNRVVTAAVISIVVTDNRLADNPIVYHNPAFERLTGYDADDTIGKNCRFLQGTDTAQDEVARLREAVRSGHSCRVVLRNYKKNGALFYNELNLSPVRDENGQVTHFVGVQNDVTKRHEAEQERDALLAKESEVATTLQRALLLVGDIAKTPGWTIARQYEPAQNELQIGGDFVDTFALDDNKLALVVGDVAGKGLVAAQHTAEIKYSLRVLLREYHGKPAAALLRLNNFLLQSQRLDDRAQDALVCVSVAVVDTKTGEGVFASGGMEPALILRGVEPEIIKSSGLILGVSDLAEYQETPFTLAEEDTLILITDGVTEARGKDRSFFGYDGFSKAATTAAASPGATVHHISEVILGESKNYGDGTQSDDICILVARRTPS